MCIANKCFRFPRNQTSSIWIEYLILRVFATMDQRFTRKIPLQFVENLLASKFCCVVENPFLQHVKSKIDFVICQTCLWWWRVERKWWYRLINLKLPKLGLKSLLSSFPDGKFYCLKTYEKFHWDFLFFFENVQKFVKIYWNVGGKCRKENWNISISENFIASIIKISCALSQLKP